MAGHLRWNDGDFLMAVVDEFLPYFEDESIAPTRRSQAARRAIIRQIADQSGGQESTLAESERMARLITPEARKKWDVLNFHQMRACASAKDDWERWAAWAVGYAHEHSGKLAPVRVIRREIKRGGNGGFVTWAQWLDKMTDLAYRIIEDGSAPDAVLAMAREWTENAEKIKA